MTRSVAKQILRKVLRLNREATKAYEGGAEAAVLAVEKRMRCLEKKAHREETQGRRLAPQKGWPRAFEFGWHRIQRKFRPSDWERLQTTRAEAEEGGGKFAL